MTAVRVLRDGDTPAELRLRCFAKGRSFIQLAIKRAKEPVLFAAMLEWVAGGDDPDLSGLDRLRRIQWWTSGLLISPEEFAAVPPGMRPVEGSGGELALALFPQVGGLFAQGPELVAQPVSAKLEFERTGYCDLPQVFAARTVSAIRSYYLGLSNGDWMKPDNHKTRQKVIHNDPVARLVQFALVPTVSGIVGCPVRPSFSYASEYHSEADLERHTDRAQCEYTMSLFVDYQPEPSGDLCPWPLIVHDAKGDLEIHQRSGAGLLFKGRELPHSRRPLPEGHRAWLYFLCFVPESFEGTLD